MKTLVGILFLIALMSCERQKCRECQVQYDPMIHPPATFSVCSNEEFEYWNGREWTEIKGENTYRVRTICK